MTPVGAIIIPEIILKGFDYLMNVFKKKEKNKLVTFKDNQVNKALKQFIINGDVNAPVSVVEINGNIYFGAESANELAKEKLEKGGTAELIDTKFQEEYLDYTQFNDSTEYPYDFVHRLSSRNKALIRASQYVKQFYDEGDMDIGVRRKEEIAIRFGSEGRQFCNLYTEGYIPDALQFIEDVGIRDPHVIESLLDNIVRHRGVLFIHQNTDTDVVGKKVSQYINEDLNYIAIHGFGSNIRKVKKIKTAIIKEAEKKGYTIKEKHVKKENAGNNVERYGIFIFNKNGEKAYNEFQDGSFKGFY